MNTLDQHLFAHLQRQRSLVMDRGLLVIFLVALIPAAYPFFYYVTGSPIWTLPLLGTAIFAAHIALTLRTLMLATSPQLWDNQWDLFALTGIPAHTIIHMQWHRLVKLTWRYHVLFALLRLGLAVGAAQLLHISLEWSCYKYNLGGLCYFNNSHDYMYQPLLPPLPKILIAAAILIPFGILESGLTGALGLWASFKTRSNFSMRLVIPLFGRGLLLIIILIAFISAGYVLEQTERACNMTSCYGIWDEILKADQRTPVEIRHFTNSVETLQLGFAPLADNGVTLAADIMRPTWGILSIARNIPMFVLGVMLYRWLTRGILRLAARQAIQRGLLP